MTKKENKTKKKIKKKKVKQVKKKTRRSKKIKNELRKLVDDNQPNLLGLVEAHKQKEEEITIPGYETRYQNDKTSNSRGILIAVKDT